MTPDCCTRAWAKATGHEIHNSEAMTGSRPEVVAWWKKTWWWTHPVHKSLEVPAPTSTEWLANVIETAEIFKHAIRPDKSVQTEFYEAGAGWHSGIGPDLRRALCAALNGSPCERKTA